MPGAPDLMLNSPFKWVGGKSRLRKFIIPMIPPHTCYLEPFAGAAWVLFGKPRSDVEVINDIDGELITFFRVVREKPEELIASFEWELVSRAEFNRLADLDPHSLTDVQQAHRFYYLIMAGWGGEARYPRFQTAVQDSGHGNRLAGALKSLRQRITPIHLRLQTVLIENMDWQNCVERYDSPTTMMYLDPPYPGNGANYKFNMRGKDDHQTIAERLGQAKGLWILSSYDTPEIRDLFAGYKVTPVRSSSGMRSSESERQAGRQRTVNQEVLISNFTPAPAGRGKSRHAKQSDMFSGSPEPHLPFQEQPGTGAPHTRADNTKRIPKEKTH